MDVEPVVTTMAEVRAYEAALEGKLAEAVR
jgi:hypothetical protein